MRCSSKFLAHVKSILTHLKLYKKISSIYLVLDLTELDLHTEKWWETLYAWKKPFNFDNSFAVFHDVPHIPFPLLAVLLCTK